MKTRAILLGVIGAVLLPASAQADYAHVVGRGETLTSVAATDGLSIQALAQANGISPTTELIAGQVIQIPPRTSLTRSPAVTGGGAGTMSTTATAGSSTAVREPDGDSDDSGSGSTAAQSTATQSSTTQSSGGSYVVQPGDTLTAIAARANTTVAELVAVNGLNVNSYLLAGSTLQLPAPGTGGTTRYVSTSTSTGGGPSVAVTGAPATHSPGAPPYPTPERVSGGQIATIAGEYGVPASLAEAIAWQESGWNNAAVSPVGAVGVMQIVPSTWSWIDQHLTPNNVLGPASASENIRAGVLLLHALLAATGGNESLAIAGYYQGLSSVQNNGMYPDTKLYVADVLSLQQHLGG